LEKEVLSRDDMIALAGPRPFKQKTTYEEFLDDSSTKEKGIHSINTIEGEGRGRNGLFRLIVPFILQLRPHLLPLLLEQ
jgi:hypothetical protein